MIVNYNGWPDVLRLASTLAATPEVADGRCELVVVDNASEGSVPPDFPAADGLRLIVRPENGGFAAGVNAGWRASRSRWLLLLNPDVVAGPDLLGRILGRIDRIESAPGTPPGVVGFGLRNPDGTRQPSVGADPGLLRSLRGVFIPRSRRKYQAAWRTSPGPVPWVTGACALVDASLLAELGGMDEEFFLYYEEVALCRSARGRGRRVEYDPSVEVVHLRPLQNRQVTPKMRVITRHSKMLYFRKHLPRWQFLALTGVIAAESRLRGLWARACGGRDESAAWAAVARLARELRRGSTIGGSEVLALAERATIPAAAVRAGRRRAGSRRGRRRATEGV